MANSRKGTAPSKPGSDNVASDNVANAVRMVLSPEQEARKAAVAAWDAATLQVGKVLEEANSSVLQIVRDNAGAVLTILGEFPEAQRFNWHKSLASGGLPKDCNFLENIRRNGMLAHFRLHRSEYVLPDGSLLPESDFLMGENAHAELVVVGNDVPSAKARADLITAAKNKARQRGSDTLSKVRKAWTETPTYIEWAAKQPKVEANEETGRDPVIAATKVVTAPAKLAAKVLVDLSPDLPLSVRGVTGLLVANFESTIRRVHGVLTTYADVKKGTVSIDELTAEQLKIYNMVAALVTADKTK